VSSSASLIFGVIPTRGRAGNTLRMSSKKIIGGQMECSCKGVQIGVHDEPPRVGSVTTTPTLGPSPRSVGGTPPSTPGITDLAERESTMSETTWWSTRRRRPVAALDAIGEQGLVYARAVFHMPYAIDAGSGRSSG
jgi:hypothetical protein